MEVHLHTDLLLLFSINIQPWRFHIQVWDFSDVEAWLTIRIILCHFYIRDLSIQRLWYPQVSWNQSPANTKGWVSIESDERVKSYMQIFLLCGGGGGALPTLFKESNVIINLFKYSKNTPKSISKQHVLLQTKLRGSRETSRFNI